MRCQEDLFPLAMSYLDRFLSVCKIQRPVFQLVGATCLLIASKLREITPITADRLVYYAANSFKTEDVWVSLSWFVCLRRRRLRSKSDEAFLLDLSVEALNSVRSVCFVSFCFTWPRWGPLIPRGRRRMWYLPAPPSVVPLSPHFKRHCVFMAI